MALAAHRRLRPGPTVGRVVDIRDARLELVDERGNRVRDQGLAVEAVERVPPPVLVPTFALLVASAQHHETGMPPHLNDDPAAETRSHRGASCRYKGRPAGAR